MFNFRIEKKNSVNMFLFYTLNHIGTFFLVCLYISFFIIFCSGVNGDIEEPIDK